MVAINMKDLTAYKRMLFENERAAKGAAKLAEFQQQYGAFKASEGLRAERLSQQEVSRAYEEFFVGFDAEMTRLAGERIKYRILRAQLGYARAVYESARHWLAACKQCQRPSDVLAKAEKSIASARSIVDALGVNMTEYDEEFPFGVQAAQEDLAKQIAEANLRERERLLNPSKLAEADQQGQMSKGRKRARGQDDLSLPSGKKAKTSTTSNDKPTRPKSTPVSPKRKSASKSQEQPAATTAAAAAQSTNKGPSRKRKSEEAEGEEIKETAPAAKKQKNKQAAGNTTTRGSDDNKSIGKPVAAPTALADKGTANIPVANKAASDRKEKASGKKTVPAATVTSKSQAQESPSTEVQGAEDKEVKKTKVTKRTKRAPLRRNKFILW